MAINGIQPTDNMKSFVEADPNILAHKSYRRQQILHKADTKSFNKGINRTINSLPLVAAASTLLLTKNPAKAVKEGAKWGAVVIAPAIISKAHSVAVKSSSDIKRAEKKHSGLTFAGLILASFATMEAGFKGINKLAKNQTVKNVFNATIEGSKDIFNKVKPDIKKVVPNNVIDVAKKVVDKFPPKLLIGRQALANAPIIVGGLALAAVVGKAVSEASKFSKIKSDIKTAQFETAKDLVNIYDEQNQQLRVENEILKAQLNNEPDVDENA